MLTVTDIALSKLAIAKDRIEDPKPENACFRIVPADQGKLTLTVGTPKESDASFRHDGNVVLVIDQTLDTVTDGRVLDADPAGQLVLN